MLNNMTVVNEQASGARMGLPYITKFCWCMDLEVGSKVIGYIHLVASLIIVGICAAAGSSVWSALEFGGDNVYLRLVTAMLVAGCFSFVHAILAVTLICAVQKRRMYVVRAWVAVMGMLWGSAMLFVFVLAVTSRPNGTGSDIFLAFFEGVLFFGIMAYCIVAVHSYYLMLRSVSDCDTQRPPRYDY